MALTPGSAQLPLTPNKQWLYIADPYTDGLIGTSPAAIALQDSLFCYAYAQGYTGIFLYEMSNYISGGSFGTNSFDITFFNGRAYDKGLEVGAVFGGPSVLDAVINFNNSNGVGSFLNFTTVISEIEWWNYSSNLPFQEPGLTGTYSFFDTLQIIKSYKPQLATAGIELYTYNGFTKAFQEEYNSGFEVIGAGTDYLTIKGNYTSTGPDSIVGGKMFQANQVIRVDNWPVEGNHTFYKLDATTPVTLVFGNTQLKVGTGKQYAGVGTSTTGTTLLSTFTGIGTGAIGANNVAYGTKNIGFANVSGGILSLASAGTYPTIGTKVEITGNILPFTPLGLLTATVIAGPAGTVSITSPTINNITQKQASGGTTLITTGVPHGIANGDTILISGLGTGFDGTWVITGSPTTTSFTFNNGNPALTVPTTPDPGAYRIMTSASIYTYSNNLFVRPLNLNNAEVRAEFEITSIAPSAIPSPGILTEVKLRGDKTFMFTPTNTVGSNTFLRSAAGIFKWAGGISGLKLIPPIGGGSGILPTYNAGTNETTFYIAGTFTGTAFDAGFLYGMVNFDVCYGAGGSYDNTPTYLLPSYGSELEQCSPYVDVFGLHDYVTNRPSYTYTQPRTLQLGQAGASVSNPTIKISWIISAEPEFLQPFFEGDPGIGIPRKNPIDAYKYLGYPITPTPNPTQSANTISSEPNANVQAEVYVDGVIIFKDTDIRAVTTGNGPNVWVYAGNNVNITSNSGSLVLTGEYCDDCLPSSNYSYEWSIISANPIGGATVSPNTGTLISGCPGGTAPATFIYTSPGVYTVRLTVTDNTGVAPAAVGQDELEIIINSAFTGPFDVVINPDNQPTCTEGDPGVVNDGDITASITAAQFPVKPVTYTWNKNGVFYATDVDNTASPTSSSTLTNVGPGVYDVTAVDSSSPPISGTQTYTLNAIYDFSSQVSISATAITCYGSADSLVTATANFTCGLGGSGTFLWNTGATTDTISPVGPGTYTVIVTDCTGCTTTKSITLTEPDAIIPTIVGTDTTCGYANGSATISNITGGFPPFTYAWSNGETNATIYNLSAGFYSVIVTDSVGCTGVSNPIEILSSTGPSISISGPGNVCCGQKATFTASVTSTEPYTVYWSNGTTGLTTEVTFSGKSCDAKFGSISAQVVYTNAPFCSASTTYFFNVNTATKPVTGIKVISGDPNNLTVCPGDAVVIEPIGGLGSAFGNWNFGAPLSNTVPLTVDQAWFTTYGTPGDPFTFTWSETDPFTGCYSEASIIINYPIGVTVEIQVTPVICGGALNSGAIDVTVLTSCSDPYIITWTGPVSGSDTFGGPTYTITNLTAGFYEVYVEDAVGNSITVPDIEVYTDVPEITEAVVTNYCFNTPVNSNSGAINITVAGGIAPYTYLWTKAGDPSFNETTQDISDLSLGTYTVVVTDDNGCTATDTYTIEYADPIEIAVSLAPPSCWGLCNGFAEIEISGGTAPYTIYVSTFNSQTLATPGVLTYNQICATTYTVNVIDANGCNRTAEFNAGATTSVITFTDRVVDSGSTGSGAIYIDTIQGGGGPPYSYSWTGPNGFTASTQDIINLVPGEYEVTIETVVFGTPQPSCAVSKKYKIQSACAEFSLEELKVMLFKFQCCAGVLAKEYVQYQEIGRPDLAECKLIDLKYLTLAINALSCIQELPDPSLSCEDISNILNQIKKICDCDCCDDAATAVYNVTYNPFTGQLDSNSSINP
jgi:hypothetical protein